MAAPQPVWTGTCPACFGGSASCASCGGRGEVLHFRCPASMADAEASAAVNALAWSQGGVLACGGGWGEQTQRGATLLAIAASERARIREAAADAG